MYYNEIKETAKHPKLLATITPFINPATIVPITAVGTMCLISIFVINKLKSESKHLSKDKAVNNRSLTASLTTNDYNSNGSNTVNPPYSKPDISDEEIKQEMIRQTMSELGKRSAKARAERKKTI